MLIQPGRLMSLSAPAVISGGSGSLPPPLVPSDSISAVKWWEPRSANNAFVTVSPYTFTSLESRTSSTQISAMNDKLGRLSGGSFNNTIYGGLYLDVDSGFSLCDSGGLSGLSSSYGLSNENNIAVVFCAKSYIDSTLLDNNEFTQTPVRIGNGYHINSSPVDASNEMISTYRYEPIGPSGKVLVPTSVQNNGSAAIYSVLSNPNENPDPGLTEVITRVNCEVIDQKVRSGVIGGGSSGTVGFKPFMLGGLVVLQGPDAAAELPGIESYLANEFGVTI